MSLLSYSQIVDLIEDGVIEGAEYENINAASLDITLGRYILTEQVESTLPQIRSLRKRESLNFERVDLFENKTYVIFPGEFILAQTAEIFHLPCDISAEYKLKSSMARMGLDHLNAGWADAGWNNSVLTLELHNVSTYHHIELTLGDKIGQMIFFKHRPVPIDKSYATKGSYNGDKSVSASKKESEK